MMLIGVAGAVLLQATSIGGGSSAVTPFGAPEFVARHGLAALDPPAECEQHTSVPAEADAAAEAPAATPPDTVPPAASFSATVATYIVPHTRVYAQPTLTADYKRLHLEARANYEALDSGSLWLGCNFSIGKRLMLDFTPMVGGVFGDVTGVAPGFKFTLGLWKLELFTEAEYLFDSNDHSGNFAYAWSELSLAPLPWLRFGVVSQRTNAYETDVEFQRGLLLGLTYRWFNFTAYVFDLDRSEQPVVLSVGASF